MSIESVIPSSHLKPCPFSSCLQSFPASRSFPMGWPFASCGQYHKVLIKIFKLSSNTSHLTRKLANYPVTYDHTCSWRGSRLTNNKLATGDLIPEHGQTMQRKTRELCFQVLGPAGSSVGFLSKSSETQMWRILSWTIVNPESLAQGCGSGKNRAAEMVSWVWGFLPTSVTWQRRWHVESSYYVFIH